MAIGPIDPVSIIVVITVRGSFIGTAIGIGIGGIVGRGLRSISAVGLGAAGFVVAPSSPAATTGGVAIVPAGLDGGTDHLARLTRNGPKFSARFVFSATLVDRYVSARRRAVVKGERTDEDVVGLLLEDLHGPPRNAAYREYRNEQIVRNAVQVIDHT